METLPQIQVSDLGLAAALSVSGFLPESTRQHGMQVVWVYGDSPFVRETIDAYRSGVLKLSARAYNWALKEFQAEVRDARSRDGRSPR